MGVSSSYVCGLVFLRLGIYTFWGFVFNCLRVRNSYVWGLVFLRLGVTNSYIWGLVFLRLEAGDLYVFRGLFSIVCGLGILTFGG